MAEIYDFALSKQELYELAEKCLEEGSAERSIDYLKQALKIDEGFSDASVQLAAIYAGLGAFQISNSVLYKALTYIDSENDAESRIFLQLAHNFLELGDTEAATYYMRYFGDEVDLDFSEDEGGEDSFRLSYPKSDDYYEMLIERAYDAVRAHNFKEALEIVAGVDPRSKAADAANHITLVCYMMTNDIDRVIDEAGEMLKQNDNLAVRCTLATAYMMEEKLPEAYTIVDGILEKDYTRLEDILLLLPLLVNLNMHVQVAKYSKRVLDSLHLQPNTMIWLSQSLYNLGDKSEAEKVMNRVKNIYGEYSPAAFYLDLYSTRPDTVEYNMNLPYEEKLRRYKVLETYARLGKVDFEKLLKNGTELTDLIRWAFIDGNKKIEELILNRLDYSLTDWTKAFYRDVLISSDLDFDVMSRILARLLNQGFTLEFCAVTQDRFKDVYLALPDAYYVLPHTFKDAVGYAVCDIIFTDEDPSTYLERLRTIVNSIVWTGDDGKAVWKNKTAEKITRLRSVGTLVGVLLTRVYHDDPDPKQDNMERYMLNERTFDKYYKIVFGDENDFGDDDDD